jgi:hypothetical protein
LLQRAHKRSNGGVAGGLRQLAPEAEMRRRDLTRMSPELVGGVDSRLTPFVFVSDAELAHWQMHLDHSRALSALAAEAPRAVGRRLSLFA